MYCSVKEAAEKWGMTAEAICYAAREGRINAKKVKKNGSNIWEIDSSQPPVDRRKERDFELEPNDEKMAAQMKILKWADSLTEYPDDRTIEIARIYPFTFADVQLAIETRKYRGRPDLTKL